MDVMAISICTCVFQQRHPINGVDVKLRIIRAENMFCLVGDGQYKVELKGVAIFSQNMGPSNAIRLCHIQDL